MRKEIDPKKSSRAKAMAMWGNSAMPMVTMTKTFDVTRFIRFCRKKHIKINAAMCWCVGKAASDIQEFFTLPSYGKLYEYDTLGIGPAVKDKNGNLAFCQLPYQDSFDGFYRQYVEETTQVSSTCQDIFRGEEVMVIATSTLVNAELDSVVSQYYADFTNPLLVWGKYRRHWFRYKLPISFQFHHVQMDGLPAARFLEQLQKELNQFKG